MESRRERKRRRKEAHRAELERRRAASKDCYCGPDDDFCGTCRVCGRPGHVRHFPGAVPYTGAWCNRHYRSTGLLHPLGTYGCWVWGSALVFLAALLLRLVT